MKLETIQAAERKLMVQTYDRSPHVFVEGHGVYLRDEDGNDYLDLLTGIGVSALGYGHPAIVDAISRQSASLIHTSNLFYHPGSARLALQLTEISGLDRVFFCNSGTEAWEAALKIARAHAGRVRSAGRSIGTRFLALEHSFHGRSMGSVATTHKLAYREPFSPLMPGVDFVRFNDVAHLRETFTDDVCAVCIEPVQGEGGIRPISPEFFRVARELTKASGALLIADEIQSGFGRTGEWFAYQHYGILPDVTTIAKPMGSGIPMGAMLCTNNVALAFSPGMHGTTFGGGPLACAVASAMIDTIQKDRMLDNVREVGFYFQNRLRELGERHPHIVEVRGMGLMLGVELFSAEIAKSVALAMMKRRIILNRTSDTVLRFLPPFLLERKHVDLAVDALDKVLAQELIEVAATISGEDFHE